MTTCVKSGIDSNSTGLALAEEICLGQLPVEGPAVAAEGQLVFLAQPLAGETITIGSEVLTFVSGTAGADEVEIEATVAETATATATAISGLADVTAVAAGATITVTAAVAGDEGNSIQLSSGSSTIQPSGVALEGGLDASEGVFWEEREPNEYSDFGGEASTVARAPINASRQNKKGTIVSVEANAGWNEDKTYANMGRLLQGFFFANAHENPSTRPLNVLGTIGAVLLSGSTANSFQAASGLDRFKVNELVFASGFTHPSLNGLHQVAAAAAGALTVTSVLPVIAGPFPAEAKLETCGYQFAQGDLQLTLQGAQVVIQATAANFTTISGIRPGAWLYIGGDTEASAFGTNRGFARVDTVSAKTLVLDQVTWAPVADTGVGKSIRVFTALQVRNEKDPNDIVRRTYTARRTLGEGQFGPQAEYLKGSVCNELTLNIPDADKLNMDLTFVCTDHMVRSGAVGDELIKGTLVPAAGDDAYNTSQDLVHNKIYIHSQGNSSPKPLFGYVAEATLAINNGATPDRALGHTGAIDASLGNFEVTGTMTAYFRDVSAIRAVRSNADVGWFMAFCLANRGFLFDIPLIGLGGGRADVEAGTKIQMAIEANAAESDFGFTASYSRFYYLPNVAMPTI